MVEVSGGDVSTKIARKLAESGKYTEVRVGFLEDAKYPDGTPVAQVAAWNNFGAPGAGIPARPFFTRMVQEKGGEWGEAFAEALKEAGGDTDKALGLMGVKISGQLMDSIESLKEPENSPVTKLLHSRFPKGGYTFEDVLQARRDIANGAAAPDKNPLVWTGTMLDSVNFEVR